jgi:uncharacterized membrane protein
MADPAAPPTPDDDDALIGFASAESLQGRARRPDPALSSEAGDEPDRAGAARNQAAASGRPHPLRAETAVKAPTEAGLSRKGVQAPEASTGGTSLYAIYALVLFAVPTLGLSALVGLVAVTGRKGPDEAAARSHFIYQQRTLWGAALVAIVGLVLLAAPFALGVPLLFILALWTVVRGAAGVWALKAGRAIRNPRGWWV